jgi:hypothetical protein
MVQTAIHLSRFSARRVEQSLAVLLISLLGMYAVGTLVSSLVPVFDKAGVIAGHIAVLVAGVFPLAVLGQELYSRIRTGTASHRRAEVVSAIVALVSLVGALWLATNPASTLDTPLLAIAAGAVLVLAGLVAINP